MYQLFIFFMYILFLFVFFVILCKTYNKKRNIIMLELYMYYFADIAILVMNKCVTSKNKQVSFDYEFIEEFEVFSMEETDIPGESAE